MLWRDFGRREISLWPNATRESSTARRAASWSTSAGSSSAALERPRRARVLRRRRRVRATRRPHLARPAHLRVGASYGLRRGRRRRRGGRARRGCPSAGRRSSACRARCSGRPRSRAAVAIRCMKSAGSSHSKTVMNSWSSIPNEYVVWLLIVSNSWPMRMCSSIASWRSSCGQEVPRPHLHERVDDQVRLMPAG